VIVNANGTYRHLQHSMHFPLGLEKMEIVVERGQLEFGQLLVLFSDGLTEIVNPSGEMLNIKSVSDQVAGIYAIDATRSLASTAELLNQDLARFEGGCLPRDDRSFLLARRYLD